jgi:hypothetical protein
MNFSAFGRVGRLTALIAAAIVIIGVSASSLPAFAATRSGSVGLEGTVPGPPPSQGATISDPPNGKNFTTLPITVQGICVGDVLVKLFKNGVFSGSAQCTNGHYSIISDLFDGRNDLVAHVYDAFDQEGPVSNTVTVTYTPEKGTVGNRVAITSLYAKRGSNPKESLSWPFTISNGVGPYAVSIDWGDKKSADLISEQFPGDFTAKHTYDDSGIYNVIVKVTDHNGVTSFLQVVAIANGPIKQDNNSSSTTGNGTNTTVTPGSQQIVWWPAAVLIPVTITTFWLGKRHQLHLIRKKLASGDRPF